MTDEHYGPEYWNKATEKRRTSTIEKTLVWENDDPEPLFDQIIRRFAKDAPLVLNYLFNSDLIDASLSEAAQRVVCCGPSLLALRQTIQRSAANNLCYVQGEICRLPFAESVFDLVYARYWPQPARIDELSEMARVMKPDAALLAMFPGELHRIETQEIFGRGMSWPPMRPARFEMPGLFRSAGLELLSLAEFFATSFYADMEAFIAQLEITPILPHFDLRKDISLLREIERKLTTPHGISDTEHLVVVAAKKSRSNA